MGKGHGAPSSEPLEPEPQLKVQQVLLCHCAAGRLNGEKNAIWGSHLKEVLQAMGFYDKQFSNSVISASICGGRVRVGSGAALCTWCGTEHIPGVCCCCQTHGSHPGQNRQASCCWHRRKSFAPA